LTWHPSKPSILGTADVDGVVRLWDVNTQASENTLGSPGYFEMDSRIVSLHFSSDVQDEFITVHGRKTDTVQDRPGLSQKNTSNTLVAFAFPKFDQIARKGISEAEGRQFSTMMDLGINGIPTISWPGSGGIETRETAFRGNQGDVVGSVLINNGTKVVLAVPGEGLLKIWDIWGKADPKQVKKQLSMKSSHRVQDFPFRI
jgi:cell division cycle 20, cofactor of APC complex